MTSDGEVCFSLFELLTCETWTFKKKKKKGTFLAFITKKDVILRQKEEEFQMKCLWKMPKTCWWSWFLTDQNKNFTLFYRICKSSSRKGGNEYCNTILQRGRKSKSCANVSHMWKKHLEVALRTTVASRSTTGGWFNKDGELKNGTLTFLMFQLCFFNGLCCFLASLKSTKQTSRTNYRFL